MKLKIISDGTPKGTHVIDEDTQEELGLIQKISWTVGVGIPSQLTLTILNTPLEIIGEFKEC